MDEQTPDKGEIKVTKEFTWNIGIPSVDDYIDDALHNLDWCVIQEMYEQFHRAVIDDLELDGQDAPENIAELTSKRFSEFAKGEVNEEVLQSLVREEAQKND
jgi:hypothetical protein